MRGWGPGSSQLFGHNKDDNALKVLFSLIYLTEV